jgi:ATP-binding cassette subfamily B protein
MRQATKPQQVSLVQLAPTHDQDGPAQRPLSRNVLTRLLAFTRPHARKRNLLYALVLLRSVQYPAMGWATAAMLSGPIARRDLPAIGRGLFGMLCLVLWTAWVFRYRILLSLELGEAVIHDLRAAIVRHLFSMPLGYFQNQRIGRLISRLTSDLEAVRIGVQDVAFVGTVQLGSMVVAAGLMLHYDWLLFLVVAALVPVLWFTIGVFRAKLMAAYRASQESYSRVTATVAESISGIRVTQSHGRSELNSQAFEAQIAQHSETNLDAAHRAAVMVPLLELNGQLFLSLLLVIGGYRALHGAIELPILVQFFFLSHFFFNPISVLGNQYNQALTAVAGAERVFALLDSQPAWAESPDARPIGRIDGRVEIDGLSFGYDPRRPILHELSLSVEPGQTVALVGHTGSGKSTLLSLIAKFYPPTSGSIRIDGHELADIRADSLRGQIGSVQQSCYLFSGSVLDNVRMSRPAASDEEIHAAARALDVEQLIEGFPQGWQTPIGERGVGLSLGQRQIICFVRAMLADPRIVLLDEATSAVDAATERTLQRALARLLYGRTSFIVAHRLSTIRHADQVLVMEAGRIVERGTHDSLMSAPQGRYRSLYHHFVA